MEAAAISSPRRPAHKLAHEFRSSYYEDFTFEGLPFHTFEGSQWIIQQPLSSLKLQQDHSPCEARQVYAITCVTRPPDSCHMIKEAVVKIKYQIHGDAETKRRYNRLLMNCEHDIVHHPTETAFLQQRIDQYRQCLQWCDTSTSQPNEDSAREFFALSRLAEHRCSSAPWLLDMVITDVKAGMHSEEMIGGYMLVMLMTKIPGKMLLKSDFIQLPRAERDELRARFKEALLEVWRCGVVPEDKSPRNIVWDADDHRCYIVDFEWCKLLDLEKEKLPEWNDMEFVSWEISERCVSHMRRGCNLPEQD